MSLSASLGLRPNLKEDYILKIRERKGFHHIERIGLKVHEIDIQFWKN